MLRPKGRKGLEAQEGSQLGERFGDKASIPLLASVVLHTFWVLGTSIVPYPGAAEGKMCCGPPAEAKMSSFSGLLAPSGFFV